MSGMEAIGEKEIMEELFFWELVDSFALCDQLPKNINPNPDIIGDPNYELYEHII